MPILSDPRHEAFARLRAHGMRLTDAYEDAGFAPDSSHASRLAQRKEVSERITEIRAEEADISGASERAVIAALVRLAKTEDAVTDPARLREIRQTLLEARALASQHAFNRARDRAPHYSSGGEM